MASEDDLLGSETYKDYEDLEDLDGAAEDALLAGSDDEGNHPIFYENDEFEEGKQERYGGDEDVLDLELNEDAEFDSLNNESLNNTTIKTDTEVLSESRDLNLTETEQHDNKDDKLLDSESDDEDDCGRGRFTRERKEISVPRNRRKNSIPDSLDAVVTDDLTRQHTENLRHNRNQRGRGGRNFSRERDLRWSNQIGINARQRSPLLGNQHSRPATQDRSPPVRHDHSLNKQPHKIHVNPKFAQPSTSQASASHSWDNNNRPYVEVPPVRQENFSSQNSRLPAYADSNRAPLFARPGGILPDPSPYMLDTNVFNLSNDLQMLRNPGAVPKPLSVAMLTGAGLSLPTPPLQHNFPSVSPYEQPAPYAQDRQYGPSSSIFNAGQEQQRPPYSTPQDLLNREPPPLFPRQDPMMFNPSLMNDTWKSQPSQLNQNNLYPFEALGNIDNAIPPPTIPSASVAPYQQQQQQSASSGPLPMWQNPPQPLSQPLAFTPQQHLSSQHHLHHPHHQLQQQQPPQPLSLSLPNQHSYVQHPPPSHPKHNPSNYFQSNQIRPEIRQTASSHQPLPFHPKSMQSSLQPPGHYSSYSNNESNVKRNNNMNKTHTTGVLTVIKTLPEHAIDALTKQTSNNNSGQFISSVNRNSISVVDNRKRQHPREVSSVMPKILKLEKPPVLNKIVTQNISNIKEIKLVDIASTQTNVATKPEPKTASDLFDGSQDALKMLTDPVLIAEPVKSTLPPEDEEDEETRLLRLKIEEQKKQREEFLRKKEMRRQVMAEQRRKELEKRKLEQEAATGAQAATEIQGSAPSMKQRLPTTGIPSGPKEVGIIGGVGIKINPINQQPPISQLTKTAAQKVTSGTQNQQTMQQPPRGPAVSRLGITVGKAIPQQVNTNIRPMQRLPGPRGTLRNPTQGLQPQLQMANLNNNVLGGVYRPVRNQRMFQSTGVPLVKGKPFIRPPFSTNPSQQSGNPLPNFNQQRTVSVSGNWPMGRGRGMQANMNKGMPQPLRAVGVHKPIGGMPQRKAAGQRTVALVENLATTTSEQQLRRMCEEVGMIEKIEYNQTQRKALVKFRNPGDAEEFVKRCQRRMVDLSMITSTLLS